MAGYSSTPLVTKLGIKPGHTLLVDQPAGLPPVDLDLGDLAGVHQVRRLTAGLDVTLTFHVATATLRRRLPQVLARTATAGMIWVCWPKKSARRALGLASDLDEDVVRGLALDLGIVDVKVCAVDDTWSGLKLVRRLADR